MKFLINLYFKLKLRRAMKKAFMDVKLHKAGKIKLKTWEELLEDLDV